LGCVDQIDLTLVKTRVIKEQKWSSEYADKVLQEYRRFLLLCYKFPHMNSVPSLAVDECWHAHILHTRDYARDCCKFLGFFLHHAPSYGEEKMEQDAKDFQVMMANYRTLFNEEPSAVWGHRGSNGAEPKAACSACNGACMATCAGGCVACGAGCSGRVKTQEGSCNGQCGNCGNSEGKELKGECGSGDCSQCKAPIMTHQNVTVQQ